MRVLLIFAVLFVLSTLCREEKLSSEGLEDSFGRLLNLDEESQNLRRRLSDAVKAGGQQRPKTAPKGDKGIKKCADELQSGYNFCVDMKSNPSWCTDYGDYSTMVRRECPLSCGVCDSGTVYVINAGKSFPRASCSQGSPVMTKENCLAATVFLNIASANIKIMDNLFSPGATNVCYQRGGDVYRDGFEGHSLLGPFHTICKIDALEEELSSEDLEDLVGRLLNLDEDSQNPRRRLSDADAKGGKQKPKVRRKGEKRVQRATNSVEETLSDSEDSEEDFSESEEEALNMFFTREIPMTEFDRFVAQKN